MCHLRADTRLRVLTLCKRRRVSLAKRMCYIRADTRLRVQFFEMASNFRVFTLQFDPKWVVEQLGANWTDVFPLPLTNECYESALPDYRPRQALLRELNAGNATSVC